MNIKSINVWLTEKAYISLFLLRLFVGSRLIYGVIDNVFSKGKMLEFEQFLRQFNFPLPALSAVVSVYAQLLAGILLVLGLGTRLASVLMIVNFLVAVLMVHINDSFEGMTPALAILFSSVLLLFQGAGKWSFDARWGKS